MQGTCLEYPTHLIKPSQICLIYFIHLVQSPQRAVESEKIRENKRKQICLSQFAAVDTWWITSLVVVGSKASVCDWLLMNDWWLMKWIQVQKTRCPLIHFISQLCQYSFLARHFQFFSIICLHTRVNCKHAGVIKDALIYCLTPLSLILCLWTICNELPELFDFVFKILVLLSFSKFIKASEWHLEFFKDTFHT